MSRVEPAVAMGWADRLNALSPGARRDFAHLFGPPAGVAVDQVRQVEDWLGAVERNREERRAKRAERQPAPRLDAIEGKAAPEVVAFYVERSRDALRAAGVPLRADGLSPESKAAQRLSDAYSAPSDEDW